MSSPYSYHFRRLGCGKCGRILRPGQSIDSHVCPKCKDCGKIKKYNRSVKRVVHVCKSARKSKKSVRKSKRKSPSRK